MVSWGAFSEAEPDLAARVLERFGVRKHSTLATLRRDGSPRISGTEVSFEGGELSLGMMAGALKALDLRRDPRLALHSPTEDSPDDAPSAWGGEAKIAGRGIEAGELEEGAHRFVIDIAEVVLTRVGEPADHLVIESWHPDRGLERRIRR